ncbi:zinc finger CCCH domain-containing protein 3 [Genypterus blacodes]|uniref:zinc finger CCCH domain-containing protein 3 n=1 Tax=Genypterus blacodes TaxID=154954 RepID=UPI003F77297D
MEEREALKRQIELLQNLINKHKRVHGDAPCEGTEWSSTLARGRGGGQRSSGAHPHSSRGKPPHSRGGWRKTYSLNNKNPQASISPPSSSSSCSDLQPGPTSHSSSLPHHGAKTATVSPEIPQITAAESYHEDPRRGTDWTEQHEQRGGLVAQKKGGASKQNHPQVTKKTSTEPEHEEAPGNITPSVPSASTPFNLNPSSRPSTAQLHTSLQKQSKFIWVKSQNTAAAGHTQAGSCSQDTGKAASAGPTLSPPPSAISRRITKKPRKLSPVIALPKTSKYKWVSSQTRSSRKPLSPKIALAQKALEKGENIKKLRAASSLSPKGRKGAMGSFCSTRSRYSWKAGEESVSGAAAGAARRKSAFHWTSEKSHRGMRAGHAVASVVSPRSFHPAFCSSPGGFKLRSRMKIIRRSPSSVSQRGGAPSGVTAASKYLQRGRAHTWTMTPMGVRRTPPRELVSFGRHKLRRLSTSPRTSPTAPYHRSPASPRVFRTRYKLVTRPGVGSGHANPYSPTLSWRTKRIQSARTFLQSRMRPPHEAPPSTQGWRGRSLRWIGGSLYRVSANKLSRTVTASMSINRTGRYNGPFQVSAPLSPLMRTSSTRHLANRAVQRSLAIIRHARQKKLPRQYCMYYNRFGKCNRGSSCPYIHDPDKVAVCTRFLRGTCKQADGSCPFSHKVAKEKMPVCSYFLKGICNNSDCPYSHVYVSRKAAVCQDFVKGYCPEGEKCKKKHTLLCPDFSKSGSCPRGTRCKLQHRQQPKRNAPPGHPPAAKRARGKDAIKRPRLSISMPEAHGSQALPQTPTRGPLELPSFISLSSSPEEADTPDRLQVKEKKLQIKPRL